MAIFSSSVIFCSMARALAAGSSHATSVAAHARSSSGNRERDGISIGAVTLLETEACILYRE
jgi:hypothetical protein